MILKRPEGAFRWITGGVTAPRGFRAQGMHCGIKRFKTKDLALIASEKPAVASGAFTANKIKASCVLFNQRQLLRGRAQAIIVNSGNANCLNGEAGDRDTREMARITARAPSSPESLASSARKCAAKTTGFPRLPPQVGTTMARPEVFRRSASSVETRTAGMSPRANRQSPPAARAPHRTDVESPRA